MAKAKTQSKKSAAKTEAKNYRDVKVRLKPAAHEVEAAILDLLDGHFDNRRGATHLRDLLIAGFIAIHGDPRLKQKETPAPKRTKRPATPALKAVERLADPSSALEDASANFMSSIGA